MEGNAKPKTMIITDDMVGEILKHLPMKSLRRLKSVSKAWKLLIESTYLTHKRLASLGLETPILKLLIVHQPSEDQTSKTFILETVSRGQGTNGQIHRRSYTFPDPVNQSTQGLTKVLGSCDGLVLVSLYDFNYIYLINPETIEHSTLSPALLQFPKNQTTGEMSVMPLTVRFGKDIVTESYKVILMYFSGFHIIHRSIRFKVKVISLDNGELRDAGVFPVYDNQISNEQTPVYAHGSLFWLILPFGSWMRPPPKLVAMDLHTESFSRVSLPSWYTRYSPSMHIWSLKDRLCLSDVLQCPDLDIWRLQQNHPKEKWEKIFSFDVLTIGQLNTSFWMLGLTAAYFRRTRDKNQPQEQEQAVLNRWRTTSFLPTFISPHQGRT